MYFQDLQREFNRTIPISDGFFKLMQNAFAHYSAICNEFYNNLGKLVERDLLKGWLQKEMRPRIFDPAFCQSIKEIQKTFLSETIKLESFVKEAGYQAHYLNDLQGLKQVADTIYDLLQTHHELYKYQNSVVSNQTLISFILEIDQIGMAWDAYLEKYLAISNLLKNAGHAPSNPGQQSMEIKYHLPAGTPFSLDLCKNLLEFLKQAFEFIAALHNKKDLADQLTLSDLEVRNPISLVVSAPAELLESLAQLLSYVSVDVIKRETLLKFVMEVVRLKQDGELSKADITKYNKALAKQLEDLHPEGYISVAQNEGEDSVSLLSQLCQDMDQLNVKYQDLMTGATGRLARNRIKPEGKPEPELPPSTAQPVHARELAPNVTQAPAHPAQTNPEEGKPDVVKKEHIGFLTS